LQPFLAAGSIAVEPNATDGQSNQYGSLPSPERLSDLIGSIYDCALDPSQWEPVLTTIGREFFFSSAMMGVARPTATPQVLASYGVDRALLDRLPEMSADMAALWGGIERFQQFPLDEPIVHTQAMSPSLITGNRYADLWIARGEVDAAIIVIARDAAMYGTVGFNRHQSAGPIGDGEVNGLRLLGPHFRRAVTISNLFDMKTIEAATFGSLLDGFGFGIVLVDDNLGIIHANTAAAAMLAARSPIRTEKSALVLPVQTAHAALERAVRHAAGNGASMESRGIGIPAQGSDGEPCIVHVLPLKRGALRHGLAQRAAAALFIAPALAPIRMPTDAMALLYDLTPAETRVFELIAAGETPAAVAKTLGVAPSTVRTHLLHLFQKTGCQRQSELVKLGASMSFPV
jgi:DNA-binding CsgD family transcriptional regulator